MSDKENAKIDQVQQEVKMINLTLQGDSARGIEGLVGMMKSHLETSKKNNEEMKSLFKEFKRDLVLDYAQNFNRVEGNIGTINEGMFHYKQEVNGRVGKIEEKIQNYGRNLGIFTGIGLVLGAISANFEKVFKWITE